MRPADRQLKTFGLMIDFFLFVILTGCLGLILTFFGMQLWQIPPFFYFLVAGGCTILLNALIVTQIGASCGNACVSQRVLPNDHRTSIGFLGALTYEAVKALSFVILPFLLLNLKKIYQQQQSLSEKASRLVVINDQDVQLPLLQPHQ